MNVFLNLDGVYFIGLRRLFRDWLLSGKREYWEELGRRGGSDI